MPSPTPSDETPLRASPFLVHEVPLATMNSALRDERNQSQSGRSLIISHGAWSVVGKFTNLLVAFLNTSLVARLLSPREFADLNRLRTFMMLFSIGLASGLAQNGLRSVGSLSPTERTSERIRQILRSFLTRFFIIASLVSSSALLVLYFVCDRVVDSPLSIVQMILAVLGIVLIGFSELTSELHRGLGAPGRANFLGGTKGAPASTLLFVLLLSLAFVLGESNFALANGLFVFSTAVVSIFGFVSLSRLTTSIIPAGPVSANLEIGSTDQILRSLRSVNRQQNSMEIWHDVVLLSLAFMVSFTILQGDIFFCGNFHNPQEAAAYIGARRCIQLISIPLMIVNTMASGIITPLIASGNRALLERTLRGFGGAAAIPAILLSVAFLLEPEWSLYLILGDGYSSGATALKILAIGQIIYVITGSCGLVLSLHGCRRSVLLINVLTLVVLTLASPAAAEKYGSIGLSVVSSSILAVNNIITWSVAWRQTGINTWSSFVWLLQLQKLVRSARNRQQTVN